MSEKYLRVCSVAVGDKLVAAATYENNHISAGDFVVLEDGSAGIISKEAFCSAEEELFAILLDFVKPVEIVAIYTKSWKKEEPDNG